MTLQDFEELKELIERINYDHKKATGYEGMYSYQLVKEMLDNLEKLVQD